MVVRDSAALSFENPLAATCDVGTFRHGQLEVKELAPDVAAAEMMGDATTIP
jgi:hypothetical protein